MKNIYLFDIDGTIYDNKFHQIDPGFLDECSKRMKQGDLIFLVSSRSPFEMVHLPQEFLKFGFSGIILEGGAANYGGTMELNDARLIPNEMIRKIRDYCRERHLLWRYSGPDGNYFNTPAKPKVRTHWRKLYLVTPGVKEWVGDDVCNILIWTDDERQKEEIKNLLPEGSIVTYTHVVEIRAKSISKERFVNKIRKQNPGCRIYAFGDGLNDIGMLKAADYSCAVSNASLPVQDAASEVIGSVRDHGVSEWLKAHPQGVSA
ncbi:HAD hydrolase family protein [Allobaculum mucilyticum]|uniref:HAD hydrolase family protein n=1 Tax=Allobaculum mucilyticum TaxID=2834459 RepID=UPI001E30BEAB|nr:HAD hydrolase family protein [Allobaculum mucilyticum]UNT96583.1 HAD family hydrolase [Allobaculum mucilyticum]